MHKTISHITHIFDKEELEYLVKDCDQSLDKAKTKNIVQKLKHLILNQIQKVLT